MFLQRQPNFPRSTAQGILSRWSPCPTGLNFGEQTGTGAFPLVIAALVALSRRPGFQGCWSTNTFHSLHHSPC